MIFGLIVSILSGLAVRPLEAQVTDFLARFLDEEQMPDAAGRRVAAFAVVLLLPALVVDYAGSGSAAIVVLGGFIGYFQAEIRQALLTRGR